MYLLYILIVCEFSSKLAASHWGVWRTFVLVNFSGDYPGVAGSIWEFMGGYLINWEHLGTIDSNWECL